MSETKYPPCPACGEVQGPYWKYEWMCGSSREGNYPNGEFEQSDLCKIRQRDALLEECFILLENCIVQVPVPRLEARKLAALRAKREAMR